jgi:hypothetical protein
VEHGEVTFSPGFLYSEAQSVALLLCLPPGKFLDFGGELAKLFLEKRKPPMQWTVLGHSHISRNVGSKLASLAEHVPSCAVFGVGILRRGRILFFEHLLGGGGEGLAEQGPRRIWSRKGEGGGPVVRRDGGDLRGEGCVELLPSRASVCECLHDEVPVQSNPSTLAWGGVHPGIDP